MFEKILALVKEQAGNTISNSNIPNEKHQEVIETTTHSIVDTLKNAVQSGNVSDVMNLFKNGSSNVSSSPLAQNMQGNLIQNLMQKIGVNNTQAGNIASSIIPSVLGKLVHKTNDANDKSFDLSSILNHFGGANLDVSSMLNRFGLGSSNEGGNISDSLKSIFGK